MESGEKNLQFDKIQPNGQADYNKNRVEQAKRITDTITGKRKEDQADHTKAIIAVVIMVVVLLGLGFVIFHEYIFD